jgi:hypothetical protein
VSADLTGDEVPDDLAAGLEALDHPRGVLHSTSWRFDNGGVVLTYAALPDRTRDS